MWVRRRRYPRAALTQEIGVAPGRPLLARRVPGRPAGRFISWPALAMLTVGSVGYLGSAPALSVFGLASVFLYVLPAFVFLVPVSLVAAELASGWPGGVYNWVREGISAPMGLRCRVRTRGPARGQALLGRDRARDADPGSDPGRSRRHIPSAGQPLGRADDRGTVQRFHPAGWVHRPRCTANYQRGLQQACP